MYRLKHSYQKNQKSPQRSVKIDLIFKLARFYCGQGWLFWPADPAIQVQTLASENSGHAGLEAAYPHPINRAGGVRRQGYMLIEFLIHGAGAMRQVIQTGFFLSKGVAS